MIRRRTIASTVIGLALFVAGAILVVLSRVLGDALLPLLGLAFAAGALTFILDTISGWISTE